MLHLHFKGFNRSFLALDSCPPDRNAELSARKIPLASPAFIKAGIWGSPPLTPLSFGGDTGNNDPYRCQKTEPVPRPAQPHNSHLAGTPRIMTLISSPDQNRFRRYYIFILYQNRTDVLHHIAGSVPSDLLFYHLGHHYHLL